MEVIIKMLTRPTTKSQLLQQHWSFEPNDKMKSNKYFGLAHHHKDTRPDKALNKNSHI
jgi:hypothetical protein